MDRYATLSDIKRAVFSRGHIVGIIGVVMVILVASLESIIGILQTNTIQLANGYHAQFIIAALGSDAMLFTAPILCALPYTAAFVDDVKSGFIKGCLPRAGKEPYIKGKVLACGLSGGLAPFLGIVLAYLLFALIFTPMEFAPSADMPARPMFLPIMGQACIFFLNGALWSLAGLCMSALTMNRYMAFASPFIFYYVLVILQERYFRDLYVLNPKNWLTTAGNWPGGSWGLALFLSIWAAALGFAFYAAAERRLADA